METGTPMQQAQANGTVVYKRIPHRQIVVETTTCSRWKFCISLLLATVCVEAVFILFTGLHLSRDGRGGYYAVNETGSALRGVLQPHRGGHHPQGSAEASHEEATPAPTDTPPSEFLDAYEEYCNRTFVPLIPKDHWRQACPCVPPTLRGRFVGNFSMPYIGELELAHPELEPGGRWYPRACHPRQRIAVIVPFRDREEHLRMFLARLHPMLQHQMLEYTIFVVEQSFPEVFNKAAIMNVGYVEARSMGRYDCYIFHDVDMLPEDDRNFYTCSPAPRHVGSHCDKWEYTVPYQDIFGGATAFTEEQFSKVNGYSNEFYGWGGEDDDMYRRVRAQRYKVVRFPGSVARYTMIKHTSDRRNPYNGNSGIAWRYRPGHYAQEGLNSLKYMRVALELRPLYTWIYAKLPPGPRLDRYRSSSGAERSSKHSSLPLWCYILLCLCMSVVRFR